MRKLSRREVALVGLLGIAAVVAGASLFRRSAAAPASRPRVKTEGPLPAVPRIDLARLDQPPASDEAGRRDLFAFGSRPAPEMVVPTPPPRAVAATPPPASDAEGVDPASGGPSTPVLPPLNLRYIGSVESARGVKVAVLVTDRREVLTGQTGDVVANRYRIARIGLESVDLEDVGTGQSRRIALRGGS